MLSRDAVIQMTEPTMAPFPPDVVKKGATWKRESVLNLGAIGSYRQDTAFTYEGQENGFDRIRMVSDLRYTPPTVEDKALPFKIKKGDFKESASRGVAFFDRKMGRFDRVETEGVMEG